MIEVESLTRVYGSATVVNNVSFSIRKGEVVGLLGHNGAGKSTIMKMITGYLEPTEGHIRVDGLTMGADTRAIQSRIGYLPENCPVWPEMTVIDYLAYQAALHGVAAGKSDAAIARAIRLTDLRDRAMARIDTLSRGYKQRVGVAQAILHEPDIIILDEPTNGLDPTQVRGMRALVKELSKHATVILSTHIMQEVQAVCERVIIMRAGRLALDEKLDTMELKHENRFRLVADRNLSDELNSIDGVQVLKHMNGANGRVIHELQADDATVPLVAQAVCSANASLYALEPQRRDLETIFAEVNEETHHAA